jgi:NTP pyrophosphatase (non-canonical NTP hydrolase)
MNDAEYLRLSEVTEKKFEEGLKLDETQSNKVGTLRNHFHSQSSNADAIKRELIYHDNQPEYYKTLPQDKAELLHAALGLFEAQELFEALYRHIFMGEPLDVANIKEEIGDLNWYLAIIKRKLNLTQEEINEVNIAKLKARYGDKFSAEKALNRDLATERKILEGE